MRTKNMVSVVFTATGNNRFGCILKNHLIKHFRTYSCYSCYTWFFQTLQYFYPKTKKEYNEPKNDIFSTFVFFFVYIGCPRKNCAVGVLVTEETIFVQFLRSRCIRYF